jgi:hypothetical protein
MFPRLAHQSHRRVRRVAFGIPSLIVMVDKNFVHCHIVRDPFESYRFLANLCVDEPIGGILEVSQWTSESPSCHSLE